MEKKNEKKVLLWMITPHPLPPVIITQKKLLKNNIC